MPLDQLFNDQTPVHVTSTSKAPSEDQSTLPTPAYFRDQESPSAGDGHDDVESLAAAPSLIEASNNGHLQHKSSIGPEEVILRKWSANSTNREITCTVEEVLIPPWFLELPAEVRKRIYRYYFFPKGPKHGPRPYFCEGRSSWHVRTPALLRTCSDIRKEALPIYYSGVEAWGATTKDLEPWLKSLSREARMSLGGIVVNWDVSDFKRNTEEQQIKKIWATLRANKCEVKKEIIDV